MEQAPESRDAGNAPRKFSFRHRAFRGVQPGGANPLTRSAERVGAEVGSFERVANSTSPTMPASAELPAPTTESLSAALATWRRQVEAELKGVPFEKKLLTRTPEGVTLRPLYTRADVAGVPHLDTQPGEPPYLRGFHPADKPRRWECCQEIAAQRTHEFNRALLAALSSGQDSVALTPDRATRAGLDPDEAGADLVGEDGLSLIDIDDVRTALRDVDLGTIPLHVRGGADVLPVAALVLAEVRHRGVRLDTLNGSITADPFAAWLENGSLPSEWPALQDQLAGWTRWAAANAPRLRTIGIDLGVWHEAGASATQELAYALASAVEHLRALMSRGLNPEDVLPRMCFSFAVGPQFFIEVAKFRAWRLLWTKLVTAIGAPPTAAATVAVHARTGRWNQSLLDPQVNLLRVTTAALSAVLGGIDSLHVSPSDEITGRTDETSRRIARNVHTLLAEEFHTLVPADAAGGSWMIESLTDELARAAWALFQDIEKNGGMIASMLQGRPQDAVAKVAAGKAAALATRKTGLVGTNVYPNLRDKLPPSHRAEREAFHLARARATKERRETLATGTCEPRPWPECMQAAIAAARDGATIGQLARLVRSKRTDAHPIARLWPRRAAVPFEQLRARAAALKERPRVFLAKMGPIAQHKARADFSAGFFAVGGFESIGKQSFETAEDAARAAVDSRAPVTVLCSTDETYPELVPAFARAVKSARPTMLVVLAGLPADPAVVQQYRDAGVDEFVHLRADAPELLGHLIDRIEAVS